MVLYREEERRKRKRRVRVQTRLKPEKVLSYAKRKKENFVTPFTSTGSFHTLKENEKK